MRILGLDPGKRNCYWVLCRSSSLTSSLRVLDTDQLDMQPDALVADRCRSLYYGVKTLLNRTNPDHLVAERFIQRPGRGARGNVGEQVNLLLGILWSECHRRHVPLYLVTASTHKRWRRLRWGSDEAWLQSCPDLKRMNDHQTDAYSLALWGVRTQLVK